MTPLVLTGERAVLRATVPDDVEPLTALLLTPEVARWWGPPWSDFPFEDDPDTTVLTIVVDGEVAGLIQTYEEPEPTFRHATVDLFVGPAWHRRGIGTDTIRTLIRHLVDDHGHHRITIDPAAANAAAIRCYERIGFEPVGVLRAYWRDPDGLWQDGLLMDLIVRRQYS